MADRFMLDSNIHDKLIAEPEMLELLAKLVEAESVDALSTHVQRDEIADVPGADKAERLDAVPVNQVPTYGLVVGQWRAGEARLSKTEPLESLREGNAKKYTRDALIGATAHYEEATLVSEDKTLRSRASKQGISVMDWDAFRAFLLTLDG